MSTPEPRKALEIFYSYAHEDERLRKALDKQLSLLKRDGYITYWNDHKITAGKEWESEILTHLDSAQIILLFISPDFISSDYCYSVEMQRAMERHERGEARVIPIILRPTDWKSATFGKLKALPSDGRAITRWPNRDEAFLNVAKGIRKAVRELAVSSLPSTKPVGDSPSTDTMPQEELKVLATYWNVPHKPNPFFTGREDILEQINKTFREGRGRAARLPLALSGLGGVGKTQTAVEYAYHYRNEYQAVLWVRAESQDVLFPDFITIADILQLAQKDEKEQRVIVDAVRDWLGSHTGWLLVLDNVEDLEMINDFLPAEHRGHILLTTRIHAMSGYAQRLVLETLEPEEGALLLLRRANIIRPNALLDEVCDTVLAQAETISRSLGGLPLGLDQAGAYIEETNLGLSSYHELYEREQRELLKRRGKQIASHPEPVSATWSLSFAKVEQANPSAADLLRLCAFLYPDAIPEGILSEKIADVSPGLHDIVTSPIKLNEAIEELLKFSLVRRDPDAKTLTIHRLVQAALKEQMQEEMQRQWAERSVRAVNRAFPEGEFLTWSLCQQYLPHALVSRTLVEQWNLEFLEAAELFYKSGYYLWARSQFTEAEPFSRNALTIREKLLGANNLDVAQTLNLLGVIYEEEDQFAQAELLLQRALIIREKFLGQEDPKVAETLHDLGVVSEQEGKVFQAQGLLERAVAIREKTLGRENEETARSLSNLANVYCSQAKYDQAAQLAQEALAINAKILGYDHPETVYSLGILASVRSFQDNHSEAEALFRQALAIDEKLFGRDHLQTALVLRNLAIELYHQNRLIPSQAHAKRALSIIEKTLGPKNLHAAKCRESLAWIFVAQHNYHKAEPLYQQALTIREKIQGQEHYEVADTLTSLGELYFREGKHAKAESCFQRALTNYENTFGAEFPHPQYIRILDDYAAVLRRSKRPKEAAELEERAKALRLNILGQT